MRFLGFGSSKPKRFEIWMEGFLVTGGGAKARRLGIGHGKNFREACINFFSTHPEYKNFDPENLTEWGCHLFKSERKARKSFG